MIHPLALVFCLFSALLIFSAWRVVFSKSPIESVLFLVLAFFSASALWLMLGAEFLAISLVLVYVGAVMVLFLFVVMMLDVGRNPNTSAKWMSHVPLAVLVGTCMALELAAIVVLGFKGVQVAGADAASQLHGNTKALGIVLFQAYVYPVQIAAVLLLVGIIAAIALTLRRRKDSKYQDPSQQVLATKAQRLKFAQYKPADAAPTDSTQKPTAEGA